MIDSLSRRDCYWRRQPASISSNNAGSGRSGVVPPTSERPAEAWGSGLFEWIARPDCHYEGLDGDERGMRTARWVAAAALIVVAGCGSGEPAQTSDSVSASPPPAETTSSFYTPVPPPPPEPEPEPAPAPREPPVAAECHPNYEGACVPIASDVDCAGGSGNGPEYVEGPVYIVGEDVYGLDDSDPDVIGCES